MGTSRDDSPGARQCPACSADSGEPVFAGPDGRCSSCGQPLVINADHVEKDLGQVVGVSDRGLRHHRNEDAFHIAVVPTDAGQVAVAIVSDGVSSAPRPDEASLTAVRTGMKLLAEGVQRGDDPAAASRAAVQAAARALTELAGPDGAPAATYVSAVVTRDLMTICWLGDSRAYWLAAAGLSPGGPQDTIDITLGSKRITRDDSLAEEIVAAGLASMDEAMASPQAHVITRWLGADLPDPQAHVERFTPPGPGVLLICSDGLWNYRPEAAELAAMALPTALTRPLDAAADLVKFAVDSGGLDNITVVLVPFPPVDPSDRSDLSGQAEQPTRVDQSEYPTRVD
jgi:serine/threonine protein phosphatase PrpC